MSAGRWPTLLAMLGQAIHSRPADEQAECLAQLGVVWWRQHAEVAKHDPVAAGRLAAAMWHHLNDHRPESPCALDADFWPTEMVPQSPPGEKAA